MVNFSNGEPVEVAVGSFGLHKSWESLFLLFWERHGNECTNSPWISLVEGCEQLDWPNSWAYLKF